MPSIAYQLPIVKGTYRYNVQLANINWSNVGGLAEVMFSPDSVEDLSYFLKNISKEIPIIVLGAGSNLLIRDGGIDGIVIKLGKNFTQISSNENILYAGAAALCFNVARYCEEHSLGGTEFLTGIPGTIGGSIAMNAGCYGSDISEILLNAQLVDYEGNIRNISVQDLNYIYRGNKLPYKAIYTQGTFRTIIDTEIAIKDRIAAIKKQRNDSQPIKNRTSGSTFKNPPNKKAWQLIDEAGCRGLKIGKAEVSTQHCNFFINQGGATALEIETLGEEVRNRVREKTGIELEWEVQIIGKLK